MTPMNRAVIATSALLAACSAPWPNPPAKVAQAPTAAPVPAVAPGPAPAPAPKPPARAPSPPAVAQAKPQAPAAAPAPVPAKPQTASPVAAAKPKPTPAPAPAPLDLKSLEQRLKDTSAIGVLTKLSLKNQVDDLVGRFRAYHQGERPPTLGDLKPAFDLLLMKVLALLQDHDPALAHDIDASRAAIWGVLIDPRKLAQFA